MSKASRSASWWKSLPTFASERPSWLIIYCGLRDRPIVVAPVRGASLLGEHVVIAHHRSIVVSAPAVDDLAALSGDDHRSLSCHYAVPVIRRVPKPGGTCLDIGAETEDVVVDEHVRKEQFAMEDDPTAKRD